MFNNNGQLCIHCRFLTFNRLFSFSRLRVLICSCRSWEAWGWKSRHMIWIVSWLIAWILVTDFKLRWFCISLRNYLWWIWQVFRIYLLKLLSTGGVILFLINNRYCSARIIIAVVTCCFIFYIHLLHLMHFIETQLLWRLCSIILSVITFTQIFPVIVKPVFYRAPQRYLVVKVISHLTLLFQFRNLCSLNFFLFISIILIESYRLQKLDLSFAYACLLSYLGRWVFDYSVIYLELNFWLK